MTDIDDPRAAARFLRTLRVVAQTAIAVEDMRRGRAAPARVPFLALAAKGTEGWRFPAAGLTSADGLVIARLLHEAEDAKVLALQAQGAAGLAAYAGRAARVWLGEASALEGVFDRDGRLHVVLDAKVLAVSDLSRLTVELMGGGR